MDEAWVLLGEVGAEVSAAALVARERRTRDERRQQVRRGGEALESRALANQPRIAPECLAYLGSNGRIGLNGHLSGPGPGTWLVPRPECREKSGAAADQALQHPVRPEPGRAL